MTDIGNWAVVGAAVLGVFILVARAVNWLADRGWISSAPLPWEVEEPRSHVRLCASERMREWERQTTDEAERIVRKQP